jgi:hypothetical protein
VLFLRAVRHQILVCSLVIGAASQAYAAPARTINLVGSPDGCPSHEEFAHALRAIFPDLRIPDTQHSDDMRVEVDDSGSRYRVAAGEEQREFVDPDRRCDERARHAAVFVALVLEPPFVRDAQPSVVEHAEPRSDRAAERFPHVQLGIAGIIAAAPRSDSTGITTAGGQLQLFVGRRDVGAVVGVTALAPSTVQLEGVSARVTRVPFDLGVRGTMHRGRAALSLDAKLVVAMQVTRGVGTSLAQTQTRLEPGIAIATRFEFWGWKQSAPFAGLEVELVPRTYNLEWAGMGVVGTTPRYWLGVVAGWVFGVR